MHQIIDVLIFDSPPDYCFSSNEKAQVVSLRRKDCNLAGTYVTESKTLHIAND